MVLMISDNLYLEMVFTSLSGDIFIINNTSLRMILPTPEKMFWSSKTSPISALGCAMTLLKAWPWFHFEDIVSVEKSYVSFAQLLSINLMEQL